MHAKRIDNESAFKLYQMLKIEDISMDNRYKYLNVMCFPDLLGVQLCFRRFSVHGFSGKWW